MKIITIIRKYKWIHKPISLFFFYFIYPFLNGYYRFMVNYILRIKKEEIKQLENYGFKNIKPYKSRSWRIGVEKDKAYRRYYTAVFNNQICFLKIAINDSTIGNEIQIAESLIKKNISFISKIICFDKNLAEGKQMLATEFTAGLHPISQESIYGDKEGVKSDQLIDYCTQMIDILKKLEAIGLVHADIHRGNLMLDAKNKLVLLDFGISKFIDKPNEVNYRYRPGTYYRETENGRMYDDAYSFLQLINQYSSVAEIKDNECYKAIQSRIGKVNFTVNF